MRLFERGRIKKNKLIVRDLNTEFGYLETLILNDDGSCEMFVKITLQKLTIEKMLSSIK